MSRVDNSTGHGAARAVHAPHAGIQTHTHTHASCQFFRSKHHTCMHNKKLATLLVSSHRQTHYPDLYFCRRIFIRNIREVVIFGFLVWFSFPRARGRRKFILIQVQCTCATDFKNIRIRSCFRAAGSGIIKRKRLLCVCREIITFLR